MWFLGKKDAEADRLSTSKKQVLVHGTPVPLDYLVVKEDPRKLPPAIVSTNKQLKIAREDAAWAGRREQVFAAAAAGVHLGLFCWNLAFWGFEGMPPDRYHPEEIRLKLGIRPGRYGSVVGQSRIYIDNLAWLEGAGQDK